MRQRRQWQTQQDRTRSRRLPGGHSTRGPLGLNNSGRSAAPPPSRFPLKVAPVPPAAISSIARDGQHCHPQTRRPNFPTRPVKRAPSRRCVREGSRPFHFAPRVPQLSEVHSLALCFSSCGGTVALLPFIWPEYLCSTLLLFPVPTASLILLSNQCWRSPCMPASGPQPSTDRPN